MTTTTKLRSVRWLALGLLALAACGSEAETATTTMTQTVRDRLIPVAQTIPPDTEPMVQQVKGFDCTPEAIGDGETIAEVPGGGGLWIEPAGDAACRYHLFYDDGANRVQLSPSPGGYMFAIAWQSVSGDLAICASNIAHQPMDGSLHEITNVTLECAFRVQSLWTDLVTVAQPDGAWAAWPRTIGVVEGDPNSLRVEFVRDSTFNILNMTDGGRPDEDGVYTITFTLESDGFQVSEPMRMTDPATNPFVAGEWEPTEAEKDELSEVIDFSGGPCPDGCPEPPPTP